MHPQTRLDTLYYIIIIINDFTNFVKIIIF